MGSSQTTPWPHGQQLLVPFLCRQESPEVDFKYFSFFNLGNWFFFRQRFRNTVTDWAVGDRGVTTCWDLCSLTWF